MKNKIWMILMMGLLLTACGNEQQMSADMNDNDIAEESVASGEGAWKEVMERDVAPDFKAPLVDGSTFSLSENKGKVILLNFWATWCGPCVGEMPAFQKLDEKYGDEVMILAVNCMEDRETVDRFIKETGYNFPIAYDEEGVVSYTYPSSGIPYTLVIGKDGVVKNIYVGAADADTQYLIYKAAIDEALAE